MFLCYPNMFVPNWVPTNPNNTDTRGDMVKIQATHMSKGRTLHVVAVREADEFAVVVAKVRVVLAEAPVFKPGRGFDHGRSVDVIAKPQRVWHVDGQDWVVVTAREIVVCVEVGRAAACGRRRACASCAAAFCRRCA